MMDKKIVLTGGTSGFGKVLAKETANKGATVIVIARSPERAKQLIAEYRKEYPNGLGKIEIVPGDLSSFDSIVDACNEVKERFGTLNMLINNAGIWNFSYKESQQGIEEVFQVNFLAPLLITHLLLDSIEKHSDSKIIYTASALHQGAINFKDLEFKTNYSGFKAYRQSKLGVILLTRLLANIEKKDGIGVYCVHPGMIRTQLGKDAGWLARMIFYLMGKSVEKGARTHLYLINTAQDKLTSGEYYANSKITRTTKESYDMMTAKQLLERGREYLEAYLAKEIWLLDY